MTEVAPRARPRRFGPWRALVAILSLAAIALAVLQLEASFRGLERTEITIDAAGAPATVLRRRNAPGPQPVVVIAHGFAGSRPLMQPFAATLARHDAIALSFDFLGHGRNPEPLTGDVTKETGATAALVAQLRAVIAHARTLPGADGRVALLGHSMASDIILRAATAENDAAARALEDGAAATDGVEAAIAVSMFSTVVTAEAPRNLLVIVGGLERFLTEQALLAIRLAEPDAEEGETYGAFPEGTARRAAVSSGVDHVGVLYSRESLIEAVAWRYAAFTPRMDHARALRLAEAGPFALQGPWILLLLCGLIALAWPLAALLPRAPAPMLVAPGAPPRRWRGELGVLLAPAAATPLLLAPFSLDFLPVLVADYLAVHFALYGAITLGVLAWLGRARVSAPTAPALILATLAIAAYGIFGVGQAIDAYVTSYWPHPGRLPVIATLALGAGLYAWADALAAWEAPLWARIGRKAAFLASLAAAIAFNLEDLFFLIIIFPILVLFFLVHGLFAAWAERATGHPSPSGLANGLVFAWALGCVFPIVAG